MLEFMFGADFEEITESVSFPSSMCSLSSKTHRGSNFAEVFQSFLSKVDRFIGHASNIYAYCCGLPSVIVLWYIVSGCVRETIGNC